MPIAALTWFSTSADSEPGPRKPVDLSSNSTWDFPKLLLEQGVEKPKPVTNTATTPPHWSDPVFIDCWIKQSTRTDSKEEKPEKAKKKQRQRGK